MSFCEKLADKMHAYSVRKFKPAFRNQPQTCLIDFTRYDSLKTVMKVTGMEPEQADVALITRSSILVDEDEKILEGELAVPPEIISEKIKELKKMGCRTFKPHRHAVKHIHFDRCKISSELVEKWAEILADTKELLK